MSQSSVIRSVSDRCDTFGNCQTCVASNIGIRGYFIEMNLLLSPVVSMLMH